MGQHSSAEAPPPSLEHLTHLLTTRFASKCYTQLELYSFAHTFRILATASSGVKHWDEPTLVRFLELPDALAVGSVLWHMVGYLGAFPFASQAPAILDQEALLRVITVLTVRYTKVIGGSRGGRRGWLREIYRSLAVYDRGIGGKMAEKDLKDVADIEKAVEAGEVRGSKGFAIDEPSQDQEVDEDAEDEEDDLVLATLDSMDAVEVFKHGEKPNVHHSIIPSDNLIRLVQLLLLIAPLEPQDSLSTYAADLSPHRLESLRSTASYVLASFGVEKNPGIPYRIFDAVVSSSMPYMFDGLSPLFEHFLFAKDLDLSKRKASTSSTSSQPTAPLSPKKEPPPPEPILRAPGEILDLSVLSQLSFFIPGNILFRRLRPLYSGNTQGFSMGSFSKAVFNWRSPTILLVRGSLLPSVPASARERTLSDSLPPSRLPNSLSQSPNLSQSTNLTFGAYIPTPWKQTNKACFSDSSTLLFQLAPIHDVFHASSLSTDYAYFNRPPTHPSGLGFGSPLPHQTQAHTSAHSTIHLGPVSLHLDDALEFGIFTHLAAGGGSFLPSQLPCRRGKDWQDRFEIEELEVWGCGGDEEAEAQRKAWAWEEREAEARRRVNLGTGDIDADRELLRMAGLIGGDRSGGSV